MKNSNQSKYLKSEKGKKAQKKAQKKYDEENLEKRRLQKREYMRRKRAENPSYCKWKWVKKSPRQNPKALSLYLKTAKEIPQEIITLLCLKIIMIKSTGRRKKLDFNFDL